MQILSFITFTLFVAIVSYYKSRKNNENTSDGYFLGGRSLTGVVIAGSLLLTNLSTEQIVGLNGAAFKEGILVMAWETLAAIAMVVTAFFLLPRYLKGGITTVPQFLERRYDKTTRTIASGLFLTGYAVILLPIVLYSGALAINSMFDVPSLLGISKNSALWFTVWTIGIIGSIYAIFGGLKAVAISDTLNGYGLLIGGLAIPLIALTSIGVGNPMTGLIKVFENSPEKFNVIGAKDSVMPFEVLFTGLIINQLYFWSMNQTIIQRALGAKNLIEAQKGLLFTGVLKILVPIIIILPGVIGFYYYGDSMYDNQDMIYPELIKKVLPAGLVGLFAAVVMGAVLSTFNSVLNSAATIFSIDIYKRHFGLNSSDQKLVRVGKLASTVLAIFAILSAPMVANAPDGLYQLLQQLNGIFFIPIASIILAGFFLKRVSAMGAKAALIVGLSFYIISTFILKTEIHFIHIWGIEFLINIFVMFLVSHFYPISKEFKIENLKIVDLSEWKYTKPMSIALCFITIIIYILLGKN